MCVTQIAKMTLRPFGTKVHNFVTILVKVFLTVVLQHTQFDCYSQLILHGKGSRCIHEDFAHWWLPGAFIACNNL